MHLLHTIFFIASFMRSIFYTSYQCKLKIRQIIENWVVTFSNYIVVFYVLEQRREEDQASVFPSVLRITVWAFMGESRLRLGVYLNRSSDRNSLKKLVDL